MKYNNKSEGLYIRSPTINRYGLLKNSKVKKLIL